MPGKSTFNHLTTDNRESMRFPNMLSYWCTNSCFPVFNYFPTLHHDVIYSSSWIDLCWVVNLPYVILEGLYKHSLWYKSTSQFVSGIFMSRIRLLSMANSHSFMVVTSFIISWIPGAFYVRTSIIFSIQISSIFE